MSSEFLVYNGTTAEISSLSTTDGMIFYNSNTNKLLTRKSGVLQEIAMVNPGEMLQSKSWLKTDIQSKTVNGTTPETIVWNVNSANVSTGWTTANSWPPLTFLEANSSFSIELMLHAGGNDNRGKFWRGFVEFSTNNGTTWNQVQTNISTVPTGGACSFGKTSTNVDQNSLEQFTYQVIRTAIGNAAGDTYLFRVSLAADGIANRNIFTVNRSLITNTVNNYSVISSIRISELKT